MVVQAAMQEDVDVIGVSILSGAHLSVFKRLNELLVQNNMKDVLVTGGGIIPEEDINELNSIGVGKLFTPGTNTSEIADYIKDWVTKNRNF
jgi:methylmalonyl-CoA mutase C-terminal domain/subunit